MKLPDAFTRYRPHIDAQLRAAFPKHHSPLYDMLRYHLGWVDEAGQPAAANGGKAVRPALCLFACEAMGGPWRQALPAAAAIELIHNFSLIHDDIQDGDRERHHQPTIWYRWGYSHGVNAGAAMNALANLAISGNGGSPLSASRLLSVSRILTGACAEMIAGQALDLSFEQRPRVGVDDYRLMISKKTGALMESAVHIGAFIGSQDPQVVEAMRRFGQGLGFIFQARDDILGVWGSQETTGKPVASDLHRRKKTFPVVHALAHAEGATRERFLALYGGQEPLSEQDVADLLEIFHELKSYEFCQGMAQEQASQTLEELAQVEISPSARAECEEMVQFLLKRDF